MPTAACRSLFVVPVAVLLITLHGSLQHEIVHGHPTRWFGFNRALGMVPLSLWMPYERYRHTHRMHHNDERLTDPLDDPESYYWTPEEWARVGPLTRMFLRIEQTLAGRVIIGCFWRIVRFLRAEFLGIVRGERDLRAIWIEHLLWCVPVVLLAARSSATCRCGSTSWRWWFRRMAFSSSAHLPSTARGPARVSASPSSKARGSSGRCSSSTTCIRCITSRLAFRGTSTSAGIA